MTEGFRYMKMTYRDEGCDKAPSCLNCPFDKCRYDHIGSGTPPEEIEERYAKIREMKSRGISTEQVALALNVSTRTVYRATENLTTHKSVT